MKKMLISLVLIVCMAAPAWAKEEINFQSFWNPPHQLNRTILEPWCAGMAKATGGKVVIHYNPQDALVKADAVPGALRRGSLDAGGIQLSTAMSSMPLSNLMALPFLVQDAAEGAILAEKLQETFPEIRAEITNNNYHLLATITTDKFALASTKAPIRTPADLAGKRVLVWAPYQIEEVRAWGGMPVQIPPMESYMALQRGLGEVVYCPFPAVAQMKLDEVAKYVTPIPARVLPMMLVMNKNLYDKLPAEAKKYLDETTGSVMNRQIGEALVALSAEDVTRLEAAGVTIHNLSLEEQGVFKNAAAAANRAYWVDIMRRNKVADPEAWITKVEKLAAETFNR